MLPIQQQAEADWHVHSAVIECLSQKKAPLINVRRPSGTQGSKGSAKGDKEISARLK